MHHHYLAVINRRQHGSPVDLAGLFLEDVVKLVQFGWSFNLVLVNECLLLVNQKMGDAGVVTLPVKVKVTLTDVGPHANQLRLELIVLQLYLVESTQKTEDLVLFRLE